MRSQPDTSHFTWFRCPHDLLRVAVIRRLDDHELRVLVACNCLASQSPGEDRLQGAPTVNPTGEPLSVGDIQSEVFTGDTSQTAKVLDKLKSQGLLGQRDDGAYVVEFKWRQYASDTSTPRTRKAREKKAREAKDEAPPHRQYQSTAGQSRTEQSRTKGGVHANVPGCGATTDADLASLPEIEF
jgi:hypothetical protein